MLITKWRLITRGAFSITRCFQILSVFFFLGMGTRVFVGGLTYRVRERDIEKFFRKYGRIKEVAMKNGFAFVVRKSFLC